MDEGKDIGKAFKERLQDIKESPNKEVWNSIVTQLDDIEQKRQIMPFFYKIAGVASVLLISLSFYYYFHSNNQSQNPVVLDKEKIHSEELINTPVIEISSTHQLGNAPKNTNKKHDKTTIKKNLKYSKEESRTLQAETQQNNDSKTVSHSKIDKPQESNHIAIQKRIPIVKEVKPIENRIINSQTNTPDLIQLKESNQLALTAEKELNNRKITQKENKVTSNANSTNLTNTHKKKISPSKIVVNSIIKGKIKKNKLEKRNHWEVAFHVAPVYYNSFTKGSSLSPTLVDNIKQNILTSSYGVSASYTIIDRVKLRTGLNRVNLSYKTYQADGLDVLASTNIDLTSSSPSYDTYSETQFDLTQKIQYFEIPLEIKYQLVDKKISIDLISGFSTLLLKDNSVLVEDSIISSAMSFSSAEEKVNNLNNLSFSGNLGVGLNYDYTERTSFRVEPMLKVQFNTYNTTTDFTPYMFGVFAGGSYNF